MVRVAALQLKLQEDESEAIEHVTKLLKNAAAAKTDIVSLPEQWYPRAIGRFEEEFGAILDLARDEDMTVIAGGFLETVGDSSAGGAGDLRISCPVISSQGKILGRQFKIHPYDEEKRKVKAGEKLEIYEEKGFKFGIAVCHDVVYPEISRAIALKDADLIFFPSRIRKEGIGSWHIYVQARALENRIPAIAPNACSSTFGGRSIVVDLEYDNAAKVAVPDTEVGSTNEQLLVSDIDLEEARKIRKIRFEDYRRDLYSSL